MGERVISLLGRATTTSWVPLAHDVWRVGASKDSGEGRTAVLLDDDTTATVGEFALSRDERVGPGPTLHLPPSLHHVEPGDVLVIEPDGGRVAVAWKAGARHNSILLTERCDNYCLMCSQPPKERNDGFLYGRAARIIDALPAQAGSVSLTGGEPTVDRDSFLNLIRHIARVAPHLGVHILSNGRSFSDRDFARAYFNAGLRDAMVGIPLYSSEPSAHDYVVQSAGAFTETIRGILSLAAVGARIEIRVVLQKATIPILEEIAYFIARNLPFVDQVALMGLEMTGLARPNSERVWIDPHEYRQELVRAYRILDSARIRTRLYNHPLCVTERELWPAATQSISDWKNDFPPLCEPCEMRSQCAGVFSTSRSRVSAHLSPIAVTPSCA